MAASTESRLNILEKASTESRLTILEKKVEDLARESAERKQIHDENRRLMNEYIELFNKLQDNHIALKGEIQFIVKDTVKQTLLSLGLSADKPLELQGDLGYLRELREGSILTRRYIRNALIGAAVTTFLYVLWIGIKNVILE